MSIVLITFYWKQLATLSNQIKSFFCSQAPVSFWKVSLRMEREKSWIPVSGWCWTQARRTRSWLWPTSWCETGLLARHGATQTLPDGPWGTVPVLTALPSLHCWNQLRASGCARPWALDTSAHSRDSPWSTPAGSGGCDALSASWCSPAEPALG